MKTIIATIILLLSLSACTGLKTAQSWAKQNCTERHQIDANNGLVYTYFECENLYNTDKIKCKTAIVSFDVAHAKVTASLECQDTTINFMDLLKSVVLKK